MVRNSLSSYVKPSLRLCHQPRGLIWLKLALRLYSLKAEAPRFVARTSAAAQP